MDGAMQSSYATALLKQQQLPESFQFFFKQKQQLSNAHSLHDLVRPRLKIAIVTETWPPEINGVALSLLQLCQGLQKQGHKILLIRPEQKAKCHDFTPEQECLVMSQAIPKYPTLQFGWPQYLKVSKAFEKFVPDVVHIVTEGPLGLTAMQAAKAKAIPVSSGFHSPFQDFSRFFDLAFLVKPIQKYLCWFHNNTQVTCVPSKDTQEALRGFGITCPLVVVGRG
ncbi:glycosyltransferase, partial [Acinetobacter pittii]